MDVRLTPTLEEFVRDKVSSGLYENPSEVVREALRLLQLRDEHDRVKLRLLRDALSVGDADLAAGRFTELGDDEQLSTFFARL